MKEFGRSALNSENNKSDYDFPVRCLCGGSLIDHRPVFDPKGEIIYVIWNNKVRLYSVETGECIRDLDDNKDGSLIGLSINPENQKSLIACTSSGSIITWKLGSFVITNKLKLKLAPVFTITRFVVTSIDGEPHGVICYQNEEKEFNIVLAELTKGKIVQHYQIPFMKDVNIKLADGHARSNYFVATQLKTLYIVDKSSDKFVVHNNFVKITAVVCHPEEEMIAVGEGSGKIKLWRNIFGSTPVKTELHWHHMAVLSLAFSQSGTVLYSGGAECVLVKWHVSEKVITKDFLPRLSGSIKQISVDPKHDKITISLDDNAIQILNASLTLLKTIQDFTRASLYDLGFSEQFPAGIKMNPRNHHLVMNGRIGHLQFFSTKNMKLLFNVDISMRNVMPRTKDQNIFSTEVTHAAFSTSWMATVENWNNKVNSPDSRLKFWKFLDNKQTYSLHTQIEQAHEKDIVSLEFSSAKDSKDLICASAGNDRCIKIWSLEKSEDVKSAKMIWLCIEQLSYKNLPVNGLGFSQDSSLIAAGFGNVLCVWDTHSFNLKCSLSSPAPIDGSTNRVLITLPPTKAKTPRKMQESLAVTLEKRRKIVELMKSVVDGKANDAIVKNITLEMKERFVKQKSVPREKARNLSKAEKEEVFQRVLAIPDLSFNQKIQIFHKLHIYYKISNHVEQEVIDFISKTSNECLDLYKSLHKKIPLVKSHEKYKLQWRFRTWNLVTSKRNRRVVTLRKLLNSKIDEELLEKKKAKEADSENFLPIKNLTHVTNVVFCAEDYSHLVIVTTPDRLLIWNLLTLKIQGSFKLHTKHITLDPLTNLVAVFTKYNELFIFHPSPAITIHHQKNMPSVYSAIWVPRENPKEQSVNVNWQATSQLLFLNHQQEICCLKIPGEEDFGNAAPFMEITDGFTTNTPFAAMIAQKITDETMRDSSEVTRRIAISGSGAVKDIINLSTHAMPPIRLLSKDFIGSMLSSQKQVKPQRDEVAELVETMVISDDENDISPEDEKTLRRKAMEKEEKVMKETGAKKKEAVTTIESKLKSLKLDVIEKFEI